MSKRWHDVSERMSDGGALGKRLPVDVVPAVARPGMVVLHGSGYAVIETVLPEFCIVRNEKGEADALCWSEVSIGHVYPGSAPAEVDGGEFPLELFKSLLLRYLNECVTLDPDDVLRASRAGRASIDVGYSSDNGGESFSVISWDMADLLGVAEGDAEAKGGDHA